MTQILIIDDEQSICWGLSQLCKQMGFDSMVASSVEGGMELIAEESFDAVMLDVRLPGIDGLSAIGTIRQKSGGIPVIIMTAFGDLETAVTAIKNGAYEYITKPFEMEQVQRCLTSALSAARIVAAPLEAGSTSNGQLVGSSPVMQEIFKQIALTTTTDAPVLITGEPGTGKELVARTIHANSHRSSCPFIAVNMSGLDSQTAEAQLFGHPSESGRIPGLLEQANGGTLFLDEVGEIPVELQVKLLRVMDSGELNALGVADPILTSFRLLSSSSQNLLSQVNFGDFRSDLFYRIRAYEIQLPTLDQRKHDIPELVQLFLQLARPDHPPSVSREFVDELSSRKWPGNIRELRAVVERAAVLAQGGVVTPDHITELPRPDSSTTSQALDSEIQTLAAEWLENNWQIDHDENLYGAFVDLIETPLLSKAFELSDRQYSAAARKLGIHRTTLKKKLEKETE